MIRQLKKGLQHFVEVEIDIYKDFNYSNLKDILKLKRTMGTRKKQAHTVHRDACLPRLKHTHADQPGMNDVANIMKYFLTRISKMGKHFQGTAQRFMMMVSVLYAVSTGCISRGNDLRDLDFADLYSYTLQSVGPTVCHVLAAVRRHGKTDDGTVQFVGCILHRIPHCCGPSHLMAYLFYLFHVIGQPPLDFTRKSTWYFRRLFQGLNWLKDCWISYESHRKYMREALRVCGYFYSWATHLGRQGGYAVSQDGGADSDHCRVHARHNLTVGEKHYAPRIPWQSALTTAGFPPYKTAYHLPWLAVEISAEFLQQIFPWAWTGLPVVIQLNRTRPLDEKNPDGVDPSAVKMCELLQLGAKWLCAWVAILQDEYPNHPVMYHPIFEQQEFQDYKKRVLQVYNEFKVDVRCPITLRLNITGCCMLKPA